MCSLLYYDEVWSGERIPTFGRTYCLTFYIRNGDYIAIIGAGTYHSLEGDSMKVAFSLNCSVVKVDHSFNNMLKEYMLSINCMWKRPRPSTDNELMTSVDDAQRHESFGYMHLNIERYPSDHNSNS
jgi:hypothetical protein